MKIKRGTSACSPKPYTPRNCVIGSLSMWRLP